MGVPAQEARTHPLGRSHSSGTPTKAEIASSLATCSRLKKRPHSDQARAVGSQQVCGLRLRPLDARQPSGV